MENGPSLGKLGFQLKSAPKRAKFALNQNDNKEQISAVGSGTVFARDLHGDNDQLIIPLEGKSFSGTTCNSNIQQQQTIAGGVARNCQSEAISGGEGALKELRERKRKMPILLANMPSEVLAASNEEAKFSIDVAKRADDVSFSSDKYYAVPVEKFGAAILRGMGWKGDVDSTVHAAKESEDSKHLLVQRQGRLGLGAASKDVIIKRKLAQERNLPASSGSLFTKAPAGNDLSECSRHSRLRVGDRVRLCVSDHETATITQTAGVPGLNRIRIALDSTGKTKDVSKDEVERLSPTDPRNQLILASITPAVAGQSIVSTTNRAISKSHNERPLASGPSYANTGKEHKEIRGEASSASVLPKNWVRAGIRVDVCRRKAGLLSACPAASGSVIDVIKPGVACLRLENGQIVDSISEILLRPIAPTREKGVGLILSGQYAGRVGSNVGYSGDSTFIVQLADSMDLVHISFDAFAELLE